MEAYIEIKLDKEAKQAILKYAHYLVGDSTTLADLNNGRKKWIRFTKVQLTSVIGELAYHFNRTKSDYQYVFLDQLIDYLEYCEKEAR